MVPKDFYLNDMNGLVAWKKAFKTASVSLSFGIVLTAVEVGSTEWADAVAVGEVSYQDQLKIHGLAPTVPISAPPVHDTSSTSTSATSSHVSTTASTTTSTSSSSSSELGHLSIHQT